MDVEEVLTSIVANKTQLAGDPLERRTQQIYSWLHLSLSEHNQTEDVCVPDFSCCAPLEIAPKPAREAWFRALKTKDITSIAFFNNFWVDNARIHMGYPPEFLPTDNLTN